MNFDRSLLTLLVLTMVARLVHASAPMCEVLALTSALQLFRLHPKTMRTDAAIVPIG